MENKYNDEQIIDEKIFAEMTKAYAEKIRLDKMPTIRRRESPESKTTKIPSSNGQSPLFRPDAHPNARIENLLTEILFELRTLRSEINRRRM